MGSHSFSHLLVYFNKYSLLACCEPGTALFAGNLMLRMTIRVPVVMGFIISWESLYFSSQIRYLISLRTLSNTINVNCDLNWLLRIREHITKQWKILNRLQEQGTQVAGSVSVDSLDSGLPMPASSLDRLLLWPHMASGRTQGQQAFLFMPNNWRRKLYSLNIQEKICPVIWLCHPSLND